MKRLSALLAIVFALSAPWPAIAKTTVRIGFFPNVTHVQALVAHAMSRQGKGWFEQRLGPDVDVQWQVFNAGPSAMEAIFAGALDVTYVGPNPALNAYVKSQGEEIRILAGAVKGGAALVVQGDDRIKSPQDFKGRKLATPQLGNTQDVAARAWLKAQGFKVSRELTDWIVAHPAEAKSLVRAELAAITHREFPAELLDRSWKRLTITNALSRASLSQFVADATDAGFLKSKVDLGRLLERLK